MASLGSWTKPPRILINCWREHPGIIHISRINAGTSAQLWSVKSTWSLRPVGGGSLVKSVSISSVANNRLYASLVAHSLLVQLRHIWISDLFFLHNFSTVCTHQSLASLLRQVSVLLSKLLINPILLLLLELIFVSCEVIDLLGALFWSSNSIFILLGNFRTKCALFLLLSGLFVVILISQFFQLALMLLLVLIHSLGSFISNLLYLFVVNLLLLRGDSCFICRSNWWSSFLLLNSLVTVSVLIVGPCSIVWWFTDLLVVELLIVLWMFGNWLTLKWICIVMIHTWIRSARLWLNRIRIKLSWPCRLVILANTISRWLLRRLVWSHILPSSLRLETPVHLVGVFINIVVVITEFRWAWISLIFIIRYTFLKLTISWKSIWIWLISRLLHFNSIWFNLETPVFIPLFEIFLLRIRRVVVGAWISSILRPLGLLRRILHLTHIFFILIFVHRWFLINLLSLLFL